MTTQLFKIITSKDEIVIGMKPEDMDAMGGSDAPAIGRKLVAEGSLGLWQYVVRRGGDGALEQAPLRLVSVLASDSLRIEPYSSPLPIAEK